MPDFSFIKINIKSIFQISFTTRFIDIIILRGKKCGTVRHTQVFLTFPQIETKESEQNLRRTSKYSKSFLLERGQNGFKSDRLDVIIPR